MHPFLPNNKSTFGKFQEGLIPPNQKVSMLPMCTTQTEQNPVVYALLRVLPLCLIGALASCGGGGEQATMERRAQTNLGRAEWSGTSTTSAERFGRGQQAQAPAGHGSPGAQEDRFTYDLPEGWVLDSPTQFRLLNLKVAGRDDTDCYMTGLPGQAGGVADNVNRWLGQFGQAPMTPDAIAALPKTLLFGLNATRVEATGPFSDSMGGGEIADGALIGLIVKQDDVTLFIKMVGPKEVVQQEKANFDGFVASLALTGSTNQAQAGGDPHRTLKHEAPAEWVQQAARQMRLMGFDLPGKVDLSVTVLGGAAGGVAANINRWRDQLGLKALPDAELMAGERIDCLGQSAYWVNLQGAYTGMGGEAQGDGDTMLAVIVPGDKETLFVKCVGPTAAVAELEPGVRSFVASLEWETTQ